ncbi:cytochrome P450 2U1-like [Amphiura filiformis]|uniref:cytochrome P450 2U1-like n=1 Tax=Amphiura filiformis TaxID=82378 RepID=UPI003B20F879
MLIDWVGSSLKIPEKMRILIHMKEDTYETCDHEMRRKVARDFEIPAGTIVVPNVWAIDHDPDVWLDPGRFDPDRFINKDGEVFREEEIIPFGIGHRACVGESLAKIELLLIFSYLLHQFTLKKADEMTKLNFKGVVGAAYSPKYFEIVAVKRE